MGKLTTVVAVTAAVSLATDVATAMLLEKIQVATKGLPYTITHLSTTSHYSSVYGYLSAHMITAVVEYTI